MSDHEKTSREVAAKIEAELARYDWRYLPATVAPIILAALTAVERETAQRCAEIARGAAQIDDDGTLSTRVLAVADAIKKEFGL